MRRRGRRGVALIVVLWISAILTLLVYSFLRTMLVEYSLSSGLAEEKQAKQLALSGIDRAMAIIDQDETPEATLLETWADSEDDFFEYGLGEGIFTLIHPGYDLNEVRKYGATDEASKVNINVAPRDMLMKIPGMTDEIADSILDWRDEDEEPRANGGESSYYLMQDPGYNCKNGPFESVEELLYLRGVTPEILYGDDQNRNGVQDAFESPDGEFDFGMISYVTVWSHEANVANDGEKRVNLNTADNQALRDRLGDELSGQDLQAIQVYRVANAANGGFRSVAHLLDLPGIDKEKFKKVVDRCTIIPDEIEDVPGLINVNTAPRKVLEAIPGMTSAMAENIFQQRTQQGADLSNIGWLTDFMENSELKAIANYITTRSFQFRFDSIGVVRSDAEGATRRPAFRRITAIHDRLADPAGLIYWKDWSRFGLSYDVRGDEER